MACGDAVGAGYEYGSATPGDGPVAMIGGGLGGFAPGEWTDDTSMAIPILQAVARGDSLALDATQDEIVRQWAEWATTAPDVGNQTRAVLTGIGPTAREARIASMVFHHDHRRSAGNGSLMRTAPVALAFLADDTPDRVAAAARALSDLTHFEADAGDACVIWSVAIWTAIRTGALSLEEGIGCLPPERQALWRERFTEAEGNSPAHFVAQNGWVVAAAQEAWSCIHAQRAGLAGDAGDAGARDNLPGGNAPGGNAPGGNAHGDAATAAFAAVCDAAIRAGGDTDTVAAIAGGLAGAAVGARALPAVWVQALHGWPGTTGDGLAGLAELALAQPSVG